MKQLDTIAGQMKKTERFQQSKRCIGRRKVVEYETCAFFFFFFFCLSANISLRGEKQWHMRCDHCLLWAFVQMVVADAELYYIFNLTA